MNSYVEPRSPSIIRASVFPFRELLSSDTCLAISAPVEDVRWDNCEE